MAEMEEATRQSIRGAETDLGPIKERFGGADVVAGILGMLAALGTLVFLSALLAAGAADIPYQLNQIDVDGNLNEVEVVGAIVALAVVFVSFFVGGWAAGRMARYDGGINGVGVALWFILLVAIFGLLGAWFGTEYNAFSGAGLPDWFAQIGVDDVTVKAIAGAAAGVVAALLGGGLGGMLGEQYHRQVDAALTSEVVERS
jgi:amino acid transporter